jgi:hypothetical protein
MPPASDTAALARSLLRLARTGAYALPAIDPPARYHVFSPRNAFAAPIAGIAEAAMALARDLGWVTLARAQGRVQLSKLGRRAVQREMSCAGKRGPAPAASAQRTTAQPHAGAAASSARGPQRCEGPLLWLRNRKDRNGHPLISQAQYEAGTRFTADYVKGQMQPRVTANWSAAAPCLRSGTPGGSVDISDAALAARHRFHAAMDVIGPDMGQLLIDVCCHDIGLESAERARRWPIRSGKVVLDMGLTALARHYGLEAAARDTPAPPQDRAKARRWADPGFTPTLQRWETPRERAANRDAVATASA